MLSSRNMQLMPVSIPIPFDNLHFPQQCCLALPAPPISFPDCLAAQLSPEAKPWLTIILAILVIVTILTTLWPILAIILHHNWDGTHWTLLYSIVVSRGSLVKLHCLPSANVSCVDREEIDTIEVFPSSVMLLPALASFDIQFAAKPHSTGDFTTFHQVLHRSCFVELPHNL